MAPGFTTIGDRMRLNAVRRIAAFTFIALIIAGSAFAGPVQKLREDVITVIRSQMAAFQRDDGRAAFSLASPDVQNQYGSAEAYLAKFAATYKPVYRPRSVTFLNLAYSRGRLVQRVLLQGSDGKAMVALFPMMQMADGSWRVDGCVLIPAAGKQVRIDHGRNSSG
jgi:hypothetical protein